MVTPDGHVVSLTVDKDIPYLIAGSEKSVPKKPKQFVEILMVPAIEREASMEWPTAVAIRRPPLAMAMSEEPVTPPGTVEEMTVPIAGDEKNLSVTERLKLEAQSLNHKLHHMPKNPFCEACIRAKITQIEDEELLNGRQRNVETSSHLTTCTRERCGQSDWRVKQKHS